LSAVMESVCYCVVGRGGAGGEVIMSVHVDFTNRRCQHMPITINDQGIPDSFTAKYIVMKLDAKLRREAQV
jgi:hypothetical protein